MAIANPKMLQKEIVPVSGLEYRYGGAPLIGNPDPVLSYLTFSDEKTYSQMERNDLTVRAARKKRDNTILAAGFEIAKGEAETAAAKLLREFVHIAFKRIRHWASAEQRMLDAIYWGWRPLELIWTTDLRWKRKVYWAIDRVIEKPPEDFKFTVDRDLVYIDPQTQKPTFFTSELDKLKWMVCTAGSVDNPYGDAAYKYVWLTYYAKSRFFEMWSQGMARSTGLLKFKEGFSNLESDSGDKTMSSVKAEIAEVIKYLNQNNVLIERSGWELEFLSDVRANESWMTSLEYLNKIITTGIAGENLSFQEGKFGTRAQAVTHESTGTTGAMPDAEQLDEWVNLYLVEPLVRLNFGEPAPDEMPEYRSLVRRQVDINNAKTLWDMGAELDGDYLAKELNIKLADEDTDMVLKGGNEKTAGPTPFGANTTKEKVRQEDEKSRDRKKAGDSGAKS